MSNTDMVAGVLLVVFIAACLIILVRVMAWIVKDRKQERAHWATDEAFELARLLFGNDPWVQIIVSRARDGYIATAHNQARTLAVSSRRFGETAEEAVRLLCVSLRRAHGKANGEVPASENWVH